MKCHQLHRWTRLAGIISLALFALVVLEPLMRTGAAQPRSGEPRAGAPSNSATRAAPSGAQARPAPNAASHRFLRFVVVLLSGLVISTARLARKFRRFWGLGVFSNLYAGLYLTFGVGLCGIPVTSQTALSSIPHVGFLGPWIAHLVGPVFWLALPAIGLKPQAGATEESQVRDLEGASSSNSVLAVIEDAIRDRILARMQSELVAASRSYSWAIIKLAARRALEEEITIGRLRREDGDAALQSIEAFQADADLRRDSNNRYTALLRLLRWCSFSRLRDSLAAAARETQP